MKGIRCSGARALFRTLGRLVIVATLALGLGACATLGFDQDARLRSLEEEAAEIQARLERLEVDAEDANARLAAIQAELLVLRSTDQARAHAGGGAAMDMSATAPPEAPPPVMAPAAPPAVAPEADVAASEPPPVETPPPAAAQSPAPPMQPLYDRALALTREGRTSEARPLFIQFLDHYASSSLAPNAMYWLGETYYHEQDYAQAILTFKEVRRLYPRHAKAAAAMLKIGYSYAKLGDTQNARFYLRALLEEFPDSDPARLARQKLATLP